MQSFRVIKPTAALVPYVRHYWVLSDDALAPVSERTLPVGCVQMVFHRGAPTVFADRRPVATLFFHQRAGVRLFRWRVYGDAGDDRSRFSAFCRKSFSPYACQRVSWAPDFLPSERGTLIHFYCEEIGKSLERVLQKGGRVITPETKIDAEGRGHFAVFADSEGNHIGLYSDK